MNQTTENQVTFDTGN